MTRSPEMNQRNPHQTRSQAALMDCRLRLRAAVAVLSRTTFSLRADIAVRDRAIAELHAADRAQDAFVIAAAHELNNPLTALKGRAQLLRRQTRAGRLDAGRLEAGLAEIDDAANLLAAQLAALVAAVDDVPTEPGGDGLTDAVGDVLPRRR